MAGDKEVTYPCMVVRFSAKLKTGALLVCSLRLPHQTTSLAEAMSKAILDKVHSSVAAGIEVVMVPGLLKSDLAAYRPDITHVEYMYATSEEHVQSNPRLYFHAEWAALLNGSIKLLNTSAPSKLGPTTKPATTTAADKPRVVTPPATTIVVVPNQMSKIPGVRLA